MASMRAVRLQPNQDENNPYSVSNQAPATALVLEYAVPKPVEPGCILVRVKASTVIRDALTWPEMYNEPYKIPGNDFAGVVDAVPDGSSSAFKVGDKVFGMTHADRCGTWAEYVLVKNDELCLMPTSMDYDKAAVAPLSALTAYQALFKKAELPSPDFGALDVESVQRGKTADHSQRILVLGATGAVGGYLLNFVKHMPLFATAATRSPQREKERLIQAGADRVVGYESLLEQNSCFDIIIDTVGGEILQHCWELVTDAGIIVSVHSNTVDFVTEHQNLEAARRKPKVKPIWFIVEPSSEDLQAISVALNNNVLLPRVAGVMNLEDAGHAYEKACSPHAGAGKIVLKVP